MWYWPLLLLIYSLHFLWFTISINITKKCSSKLSVGILGLMGCWNFRIQKGILKWSGCLFLFADNWYGLYETKTLQYISWGRATKFKNTLNRTTLVSKSDNFRQSVIVHELGHALCSSDNPPESLSIMRYNRDRETCITPQQDDINGVITNY